jgi:zinc protease
MARDTARRATLSILESMMRCIFARVLAAFVVLPAFCAPAQPLPTDPRLVTGTLDNGLSYIVRKHDNPPGRAELWLHVSTGSLNETDKQRGIAHFTEHMAFNGSENFPPGSVISFFESLGLTFGQHQNAFTGFDQTSYLLSLPDNKPETLQKGMRFLSDVAMKLSMPEAEIENERQVILEERRSRLSGRQRVQDYWFEHLAPGSILGKRIPIGVEETIKGVNRQDFLDYYTKWYAPSNMVMMVVADMDTALVVDQIKASLSSGVKVDRPRDQEVGIKPYDTTRAIVASDAELTDARIELIWIAPAEEPTTTVELLRRDMVDRIATWCFDRRLDQKIAEGKVSFQRGGPASSDMFRVAHLSSITASGEPGKWKSMLTDLAVEVQRARLHGFAEQEVADARAEILSATEQSVKTEPTMNAGSMLAMWNGAISAGVPITSAQQDLDAISKVLPTITPADVNARFNSLFNTSKPVTFSLQLPTGNDVPTEAQLIELGTKALDVKPENEAANARPTAFMDKLPDAGKVAEHSEHAASAVTSAWLSNNARVHYRFMDYKKDQVLVTILVAGGEIKETAANRGITQAAAIGLSTPATTMLTSTNIRDLLTGKNVGVRGRPAPDALMITVAGNPTDLEHGMQLAHLLITAPVVEKAALDIWKEQVRQFAENRTKTVELALSDVVTETLYPKGEVRLGPLEPEQANRHTPEAATAWLREVLSTGPIEVSVVGDLPKERAMELVQRYIGSLPSRPRVSDALFTDLRHIARPTGPLRADKGLATQTDKAVVMSGFFGTDAKNLLDVRLLNMASRILSSRAIQDIREKQQLAYAPQVASSPAAEYPGMGFVFFASPTEPAKVGTLRDAITSLFDSFSKEGATADEMETVRKQVANTLDEQMREPTFWSTRLTTLTYRGTSLDDILGAPAAYQAFTADQIREAFNRYYKPEGRFELSVTPAKAPK